MEKIDVAKDKFLSSFLKYKSLSDEGCKIDGILESKRDFLLASFEYGEILSKSPTILTSKE